MDDFSAMFFWLVFGGLFVLFAFNIIRRGGFKGAIFNARVARTVGEVEGEGPVLAKARVKVHLLEKNAERMIGLEFVSTSLASYEMMPLMLSASETRKLITVLEQTVAHAERG